MEHSFYFIFGCGQPHANCYHLIKVKNEDENEASEEARELMFQRFGKQWSMQYKTAEAAGVEMFGLTQLI